MANELIPATEFSALPLETIISGPLVAAVKAQALAAQTTANYIKGMLDENGKPDTVDFTLEVQDGANARNLSVKVPLLAILPVPHLRIDSVTTNFKYEVSQILADKRSVDGGVSLDFQAKGLLKVLADVSLKGNITASSSHELTTNRTGAIEVTVHASEAPMPDGLSRILSLLSSLVPQTLAPAPAVGG